ncbi:MAG: SDR family oxidoreductase [Chloroflexi bacterium]|nr:SDR family oxidoreductase [Chloroflexota bacterium]MQC47502.1 SDR family oxidoreductase [Chloroflexota bacterium]
MTSDPTDRPTQALVGKRAMVIGADNPAGGAIARAYAEAGADVALCALTADEAVMRARAVRRVIEAMGRRAPEYIMDVTLGRNVQVTTRQIVKELGGLDIVAVCPDQYFTMPIGKTTDTDLARTFQVNFMAHFFAVRAVAEEFRRQQQPGRIVLVTSMLAEHGVPHTAAYAAAHGAVQSFARAAGAELAPDGITVNAIALGQMEWMEDRLLPGASVAERGERATMAARPGTPAEVGALALHLSSEGATQPVTGQIFRVGGMLDA